MAAKIVRANKIGKFNNDIFPKIVQTVLANRGVNSVDEIDLSLKNLLPIHSLSNVDIAAKLIADTIYANEKILIVADFDADGATACAVMVRLLLQMGALVNFKVPHRINHGYGLSTAIVSDIILEKPDLIITVDNGISSHEGISMARKNGIKVLVTDHHLPADTLPDANVIVNPNLPGDNFASKNLAGVGVAFYVACGLHNYLKNDGWYSKSGIKEPIMTSVLDLVALGTVADVVPLDKNNRILVESGLKKIRNGNSCAGIKALFKVSNKDYKFALASDIGFMIGPRINAAGRMQDMTIGINCLLADTSEIAEPMAMDLNTINTERKEIEQTIRDEADSIVENFKSDNLPFGISLYGSTWHAGVVGIVAGRIKEKYNRPVIVFAKTTNNMLKGSARSIKGMNIRDVIDNVDKCNKGLIDKFGGHAMAAGLSIHVDDFPVFKQKFNSEVAKLLSSKDLSLKIISDGSLASDDFSLELAEILQNITPWGHGFVEPVFDNDFFVIEYRVVGSKHLKLVLQPCGTNLELDAIAFNMVPDILPPKRQSLKIAFQLDINRWQGRVGVQLRIIEIET